MLGNCVRKRFEGKRGNSAKLRTLLRPKYNCCFNFSRDSAREIDSRTEIDWDDDHTAKRTSQECADPFGRVMTPQNSCITLSQAAEFKLAGHAVGLRGNLGIGPTFHSIAALLAHGDFLAIPRVALDKI